MNVSNMNLRKTLVAVAAAGALGVWSASGLAESTTPAPGYGPGMMGGYAAQAGEAPGPGYGPGWGYGMGPWGRGGYGGGWGMGGYGRGYGGYGPGYGMGPGMMYGYGGGYGPGMMGGFGPGYGMGPGMMYGYGHGFGPGMMYGYGPGYAVLDLTDEQSAKIEKIYADVQQKQWDLATKLFAASGKLHEALAAENPDRKAVAAAFKAASDLRLQRLELGLDTRAKVDAVLTKEQREQVQAWRSRGFGPAW